MASHRIAQIRRASVVVVFGLLTLAPPLASRWMAPITSAVSLEVERQKSMFSKGVPCRAASQCPALRSPTQWMTSSSYVTFRSDEHRERRASF